MDSDSMEIENPHSNWFGFIVTMVLAASTWLSKHFAFSITAFVYKVTHFSLSVFLANVTNVDEKTVQCYVDGVFHYTLAVLSLVLVYLKISNELKRRKKIQHEKDI